MFYISCKYVIISCRNCHNPHCSSRNPRNRNLKPSSRHKYALIICVERRDHVAFFLYQLWKLTHIFLSNINYTLCSYSNLLLWHWPPCIYIAWLEDHSSVAKDEVHSAINVAFLIELSLGVNIESVLIPFKWTAIEHREISTTAQSHCLVVLWACCVAECDATCYEPISCNNCKM